MSGQLVLWETHDHVLVLTLNDPTTRNSLSKPLVAELLDDLDKFEADPNLKVMILTGADPAFCSGANVREFRANIAEREAAPPPPPPTPWQQVDATFTSANAQRRGGLDNREIVFKLMASQKPSIAAVNGAATGLGHGLALSCDLRVASEKATFAESFPRMGIPPGDG